MAYNFLDQGSIEQQAQAGNNNPQQTQNFLTALKGVGAGSNNTFMHGNSNNAQPQSQPLLNNSPQTFYTGGNNPNMPFAPGNNLAPNPNLSPLAPGSFGGNIGNIPNVSNGIVGNSGYPPTLQQYPYNQNFSPAPNGSFGGTLANPNPQSVPYNPGAIQQAPNLQQSLPNYGQIDPQALQQMTAYQNYLQTYSNALSDETKKTEIEPADSDVKKFMDSIGAHSYEYKDKKFGEGRFVSPMAQELERTPIGKSAIVETKDGKMVNYARLGGITLSSVAMLNSEREEHEKRIEKLEAKISKLSRRK